MRTVLAAVLFLASAVPAFSAGESAAADSNQPTATAVDVIAGLYQFDRFQQSTIDGIDEKGNQEIRNLATLRAEDATQRDEALKKIQAQIGTQVDVGNRAPVTSARPAAAEDSEGPAYVRAFYAAQVSEYKSAVGLLERYLNAPDNEFLHAFARHQLPILRSELEDAERTMDDK